MKRILSILIVLFSLTFVSCEDSLFGYNTYRYEVTGTSGSYSVAIQNTDNNTQHYDPVGDGWWYEWEQSGTRWLYLSAQNNYDYGSVTVRITKNGRVLEENTSYGGYTIATVSGNY